MFFWLFLAGGEASLCCPTGWMLKEGGVSYKGTRIHIYEGGEGGCVRVGSEAGTPMRIRISLLFTFFHVQHSVWKLALMNSEEYCIVVSQSKCLYCNGNGLFLQNAFLSVPISF